MNTSRDRDGMNESTAEKAVEDLVRASADAMEVALKGEWAKDINAATPPIHPLLAHPTAMMAAATVVGMGVSSQIAGMWLGFMKGFNEASEKATDAQTAETAAEPKKAKEKDALRVVVDNGKAAKKRAAVKKVDEPASSRAEGSDDLKRISGVGPKLASVLAERGFGSFSAIASMSAKQAAALDRDLGLEGRIERDDWIGQAKTLLGEAR